jgi:hypothetical protein
MQIKIKTNKKNNTQKTRKQTKNRNKQQQHNLRGILNGTLMCVLYTGTQIRRRIHAKNHTAKPLVQILHTRRSCVICKINHSFNQSAIIYTS